MATFERHCQDCEKLLFNRFEDVNHWMDLLFSQYGPKHRRHRHHWRGVREAHELFGEAGAKAAIVHIVRDCGAVPTARSYDETELGIVLAPEYLFGEASDKFRAAVEQEWAKYEI